ncbi:MAG: Unknown protein [uncultured Sulfurovum sp.]|uniref:YTH domain-containing protein n=1 Tax=uncultured Sulfurovum sp. TaxID=269237 RepID=A0A6S6SPH9_9BACT|nr:MAG: Unknown protein [uncultured Sulfurovum sp.]
MSGCNEFVNKIKNEMLARPDWFSLTEPYKAKDEDITIAEQKLGIILPKSYKCLVSNFSVGDFAFQIIYSLWKDSEFNLLKINQKYNNISKGFILFSDNEVGDFYGFKIFNNICLDEIWFYDHEVNQWEQTKYNTLFEIIYDVGLKLNSKNRPD